MFIGHFALGFAAKKAAPRVPLGTLLLAVAFVDLLWPVFLLLGLEHVRIDPGNTAFTPLDFSSYPFTHSIPGSVFWARLLAGAWYSRRRIARGAGVIAALVLSHWVLDAVSHRPDMPILPGGPYVGLGLWNSIPATIIVEGAMFAAGVAVYARSTKANDRVGRWGFVAVIAFLSSMYVLSALAPPPPGERALAYGALAAWLLVPWPYWLDRHRSPVAAAAPR
jgi:hypothetical protein